MMKVCLKKGREASVIRHHPWVFSGCIGKADGQPGPGVCAELFAADGRWLARAACSPASMIALRIWTFDRAEEVDAGFFSRRLSAAVRKRDAVAPAGACRLVNAESDGLPGLVVDRYADFLVCQFLSAGVEAWKVEIVRLLEEIVPCAGIYERSDTASRIKEGLEKVSGVLTGQPPPELIEVREGPLRCLADIVHGHKTGLYLDQRENRALLAGVCRGRRVLNCFSYTGGFGLWALHGEAATLVSVESSETAQELFERQRCLNGFDDRDVTNIHGDVFSVLRGFRDARKQFDVIVLDPPKFADSARQVQGACRGYKDINLLAFKLLAPGGHLFTFSCSQHMSPELFQKVVAGAALDAGCDVQIVGRLSQGPDHPVGLHFPEGAYLKGLICLKG